LVAALSWFADTTFQAFAQYGLAQANTLSAGGLCQRRVGDFHFLGGVEIVKGWRHTLLAQGTEA
jgi:hypothetical protein